MSQLSNNATSDLANPNGLQLPAKPKRATRSDKGKSKGTKTAEAAITDIIHALMGVPKADIGRVLDAAARFHELDGKE